MNSTRPPRTPGAVYAALSLVLLTLVALIAFTARQPPPPTIAEFAPQAVEQIVDSPTDQSSRRGAGAQPTTTPAPDGIDAAATPAPIDVPRVRRCVGDPPRQIEDPQSPPCVPYWVGDNGGATYKGVTGSEIRVMVPTEDAKAITNLQAFFNKRFEFYGRQLQLRGFGNGEASCTGVKATATSADEVSRAFASLSTNRNNETCYFGEIARRRMVGSTGSSFQSDTTLEAQRPYVWQYPMATNRLFDTLGEWTCARLAGRPAAYADGDDGKVPPQPLSTKRRVFGMVRQQDGPDQPMDTTPIERALNVCGERIKTTVSYPSDGSGTTNPSLATNTALRMRSDDVTSIYCLNCSVTVASAATSQNYYPEWLATNIGWLDYGAFLKTFWSEPGQRQNILGITAQPRAQSYANSPAIWAFQEADPTYNPSGDALFMLNRNRFYRSLLLLASGIQMAGPQLTPATFERGLHRAVFPNPDTEIRAGHVGFEDGSHSMTRDVAEFYWMDVAQSPYAGEGTGALCYVDGGTRRAASFPAGDQPFFKLPCDSGAA